MSRMLVRTHLDSQPLYRNGNWLHLFHMLAILCSKSFKLGFSSTWTENFQIYKLDLENFQNNIYFCFIDYNKAFDCVDHNKLWNSLKEMRIPDHLTCLLRSPYATQNVTVRTGHEATEWLKNIEYSLYALLFVLNTGGSMLSWHANCMQCTLLPTYEHISFCRKLEAQFMDLKPLKVHCLQGGRWGHVSIPMTDTSLVFYMALSSCLFVATSPRK